MVRDGSITPPAGAGCSVPPRNQLSTQSRSDPLKLTIGATVVRRMELISLVVLAGVSGCTPYDPPLQGDHASKHYQDDLKQCRTSSREAVRLKNASTLESWVISPITGPPAVRAAIRKCMEGKGYAPEKARS